MKQCDFKNLLNEDLIKYYWLGFLLADGNFSSNRIRVKLSTKDIIHLEKLQKYLDIKNMSIKEGIYPSAGIAGMDTKIVKNICKKYEISSNKTYNPPNISSIKNENLKALSIGIIDGDGSISNFNKRKTAFIRVKMHSSWKEVLEYIFPGKVRMIKAGYAEATIADWESVKELKIFALSKNLPILNRKWDKIDLSHFHKLERNKMKNKETSVRGEK